jgi:oligopeptide transport system permease protein
MSGANSKLNATMLKFLFRRLCQFVPVLLIVATATFFMVRLAPGGPFDKEQQTTAEIKAMIEKHYGLDRPLWQQYLDYLWHAVRGDLGPSFKYANRSVNELIADAFPVSLELGLWSLLIALALGITLGVIASLRPNSWIDYLPSSIALGGVCLPTFVMGPIFVLVFALALGQFNASGWDFPRDRVLPSFTLGLFYAGYVARLTRSGMLEVLRQEYIRTARAKGASELQVVVKHGLRNGLLPVVSFLGPATAGIVTGSFVIETIFNIPGLGRFFVTSAFNRDYTMVLGTVLFYATLILVLNLISDIALALLNPKIRLD